VFPAEVLTRFVKATGHHSDCFRNPMLEFVTDKVNYLIADDRSKGEDAMFILEV
jgi:hypothetical protein